MLKNLRNTDKTLSNLHKAIGNIHGGDDHDIHQDGYYNHMLIESN